MYSEFIPGGISSGISDIVMAVLWGYRECLFLCPPESCPSLDIHAKRSSIESWQRLYFIGRYVRVNICAMSSQIWFFKRYPSIRNTRGVRLVYILRATDIHTTTVQPYKLAPNAPSSFPSNSLGPNSSCGHSN